MSNKRLTILGAAAVFVMTVVAECSLGAKAGKPVKFVAHRIGRFRSEACGVADCYHCSREAAA